MYLRLPGSFTGFKRASISLTTYFPALQVLRPASLARSRQASAPSFLFHPRVLWPAEGLRRCRRTVATFGFW